MVNWIKADGTPENTPSDTRLIYITNFETIALAYCLNGLFYHQTWVNDAGDGQLMFSFRSRLYQVTHWCEVDDIKEFLPKDDN